MSNTLMEGVEVEAPDVRSGGILDISLPAPQGWMQGLSIPFYGCGEPEVVDRCVTAEDVPLHKTAVAEFHPFGIRQSATCSSLSRLDQKKHAEGRLDSTTEWAVARQLATDGVGLGTPSFDDGVNLGVVADGNFALAVGTLEQAAADAGFGAQWWLHAPVKAAAFLAEADLLNGTRSPTGAPWVVSVGYPVQGATTIRLWATGPVWAAVDEAFVLNDLDRRNNADEAFAQRSAIVAFDPCINLHIDVTVPASPNIGSE
jgi:hypothetical protein